MNKDLYFKVKKEKIEWLGERYFRFTWDKEKVIQVCKTTGQVKKGKEENTKGYQHRGEGDKKLTGHSGNKDKDGNLIGNGKANRRSVWSITTQPYSEAHFATFPEELPELCIKAGSSEYGCCSICGLSWQRIIEKNIIPTKKAAKTFVVDGRDENADANDQGSNRQKDGHKPGYISANKTIGWEPTCQCNSPSIVPAIILDPFSGAGTTAMVAKKLNRNYIGIELNEEYITISTKRLSTELGLFQ